jgi:hypothetical protein
MVAVVQKQRKTAKGSKRNKRNKRASKYYSGERYTQWLQLQMTHYNAAALLANIRNNLPGPKTIFNIKVLSAPYTGEEMMPWREVVNELHDAGEGLCGRIEDLESELQYKLEMFTGRTHCEVLLANFLAQTRSQMRRDGSADENAAKLMVSFYFPRSLRTLLTYCKLALGHEPIRGVQTVLPCMPDCTAAFSTALWGETFPCVGLTQHDYAMCTSSFASSRCSEQSFWGI